MDAEYYIPPEVYAEAEKNGISSRLLENRVRVLGWSQKKAIETPKRVSETLTTKEQRKKAKENDIPYSVLATRIRDGWDSERATTTPVMTRKQIVDSMHRSRKIYTDEILALAEKNGVSYGTLTRRVTKDGWSVEKAASTPPMSKADAVKLRKKNGRPKKEVGEEQFINLKLEETFKLIESGSDIGEPLLKSGLVVSENTIQKYLQINNCEKEK